MTALLAAAVPHSPNPANLPGSRLLMDLGNGVEGWALVAAVLGIVVGAVVWAFGHYSQNYQQSLNGKKGVLVSALAALLIGAAPQLVQWFQGRGGSL